MGATTDSYQQIRAKAAASARLTNANGEYRNGLYNHYYPPNTPIADCISPFLGGGFPTIYTPFGWKTARSKHSGGVNALRADSSLTFIADSIDASVWKAISTRNGSEVPSVD